MDQSHRHALLRIREDGLAQKGRLSACACARVWFPTVCVVLEHPALVHVTVDDCAYAFAGDDFGPIPSHTKVEAGNAQIRGCFDLACLQGPDCEAVIAEIQARDSPAIPEGEL